MALRARAMCMPTMLRPTFGKRSARAVELHPQGAEHRRLYGMVPSGSSAATRRRMGTTSMMCTSMTSPQACGVPCTPLVRRRRSVQTTVLFHSAIPCSSLVASMDTIVSTISGSCTCGRNAGARSVRSAVHHREAALDTQRWFTATPCMSSAVGMAMTLCRSSSSTTSPPTCGSCCQPMGQHHVHATATPLSSAVMQCSLSAAWTRRSIASQTSTSTTSLIGCGRK
mmetsp:Transcript_118116/g.294517  ORF Transcript_118116/g.294517 Transcript_118116/m.294517 type:complete len:226 (-) Transcript_118116:2090-2767(-)